jgi:hypothetical protein
VRPRLQLSGDRAEQAGLRVKQRGELQLRDGRIGRRRSQALEPSEGRAESGNQIVEHSRIPYNRHERPSPASHEFRSRVSGLAAAPRSRRTAAPVPMIETRGEIA